MKVLIAEDQETIGKLYKQVLELHEHTVLITKDGEECLAIYRSEITSRQFNDSKKPPFDIVVLDSKMPKKSGVDVAKAILDLEPDQEIMFASSYVKETLVNSLKDFNRIITVMQKPFGVSTFVRTIEDKEIFEKLHRLNKIVGGIKNPDPSQREIAGIINSLTKIQKPDVWYALGNVIIG